jgi:protein-S-isoprenylcysteine O-methyltransferase Ste14
MQQYIILFIGWASYYSLHSLLAHQATKEHFKKVSGNYNRFYRLIFNTISIIGFISLLWFQFLIPSKSFMDENNLLQLAGIATMLLGIIVLLAAFASFNKSEFIGIEQLTETPMETTIDKDPHQLVKTGMYRYVRHPLYFGLIIILLGAVVYFQNYSTLIFVVTTFIYLPIGVSLEEKKLVVEFGQQYLQYKKEVKMLVPFLF